MSFLEKSYQKTNTKISSPAKNSQKLEISSKKKIGKSAGSHLFSDLTDFRQDLKRKFDQNSPQRKVISKQSQSIVGINTESYHKNEGLHQLQQELLDMSHNRHQKFLSVLSPQFKSNISFSNQQKSDEQLNGSYFGSITGSTSTRPQYHAKNKSSAGVYGSVTNRKMEFSQKFNEQLKKGSQAAITVFNKPAVSPLTTKRQHTPNKYFSPSKNGEISKSFVINDGASSSKYKVNQQSPSRRFVQEKIKSISPNKKENKNSSMIKNSYQTNQVLQKQKYRFEQHQNLNNYSVPNISAQNIIQNTQQSQIQQNHNNNNNNNNLSSQNINNNISQLLEETRLKTKENLNYHKSYRDQLKHRNIGEIIPMARIQELQDVLVDSNDQEFGQLPQNYIEELQRLSSIINFKIKSFRNNTKEQNMNYIE